MSHSTSRSQALFADAQKVIPGGVNSPVRAFKAVGGTPIFIKRAKGAYIYDEDGRKLLDGPAGMWCMQTGYWRQEIADSVS